jgi:hypothetical protein
MPGQRKVLDVALLGPFTRGLENKIGPSSMKLSEAILLAYVVDNISSGPGILLLMAKRNRRPL